MNTKRAMLQILRHLTASGVTHIPKVTPLPPAAVVAGRSTAQAGATAQVGRSGQPRNTAEAASAARAGLAPPLPPGRQPGTLISHTELDERSVSLPVQTSETLAILSQSFSQTADKAAALGQLADVVSGCTRCHQLCSTRKQTVFGVGHPDAKIMFIGEAPGADEDAQGEPFVGKAGQLLDRIIAACTLKREDIYICNVLRCRPPGNRTPLPQEAANCREFLDAQIHVVQPEYIVCWGSVAAQNLLNDKRPIGKMRGQFMTHKNARVLCTYHPSYLLRYPAAKAQVWEDMKYLMRDMGVDLK